MTGLIILRIDNVRVKFDNYRTTEKGGDLNRSMQHFDFRPLKMECRDEIQNTNKVYGRTKGTDMGSLATWRVHEFNWPRV